jgi:hypothetical protein
MEDDSGYKEYKKLAVIRRGLILNEVAHLERIIDLLIAYHFCGYTQKAFELMNNVLSTKFLFFEAKVQMLKWIMPNLSNEYPDIFPDILNKIIPQRNVFAHHALYTPNRKPENNTDTHFIKFTGKEELLTYTPKDIEDIIDLLNKYIPIFTKLTEGYETAPPSD